MSKLNWLLYLLLSFVWLSIVWFVVLSFCPVDCLRPNYSPALPSTVSRGFCPGLRPFPAKSPIADSQRGPPESSRQGGSPSSPPDASPYLLVRELAHSCNKHKPIVRICSQDGVVSSPLVTESGISFTFPDLQKICHWIFQSVLCILISQVHTVQIVLILVLVVTVARHPGSSLVSETAYLVLKFIEPCMELETRYFTCNLILNL